MHPLPNTERDHLYPGKQYTANATTPPVLHTAGIHHHLFRGTGLLACTALRTRLQVSRRLGRPLPPYHPTLQNFTTTTGDTYHHHLLQSALPRQRCCGGFLLYISASLAVLSCGRHPTYKKDWTTCCNFHCPVWQWGGSHVHQISYYADVHRSHARQTTPYSINAFFHDSRSVTDPACLGDRRSPSGLSGHGLSDASSSGGHFWLAFISYSTVFD